MFWQWFFQSVATYIKCCAKTQKTNKTTSLFPCMILPNFPGKLCCRDTVCQISRKSVHSGKISGLWFERQTHGGGRIQPALWNQCCCLPKCLSVWTTAHICFHSAQRFAFWLEISHTWSWSKGFFFFFFLENDKQFSSQKIVQRPFFHAQITPKQLGFITSDLACAECNPEGGMHFLPCLKKFHFAIAN